VPNFFQGLEQNTCSIQPALKNTAPGFLKSVFSKLEQQLQQLSNGRIQGKQFVGNIAKRTWFKHSLCKSYVH